MAYCCCAFTDNLVFKAILLIFLLPFQGTAFGRQPTGGHQRAADEPAPPPMAQRLPQPAAVVRLCLHTQVGPMAQSQVQSD